MRQVAASLAALVVLGRTADGGPGPGWQLLGVRVPMSKFRTRPAGLGRIEPHADVNRAPVS